MKVLCGREQISADLSWAQLAEHLPGWQITACPPDDHVSARFFSGRTDEQIVQFASRLFEVVDFHLVRPGTSRRFQSLTLRRP